MKNSNQERLGRAMKQYHRKSKWPLANGIYIPLVQDESKKLSCCDEVVFILNDRLIYVDWVHPRRNYSFAIAEMAHKVVGDCPTMESIDLLSCAEKKWKKQGRSRKKPAFYIFGSNPMSQSEREYQHKFSAIYSRMELEGVDSVVHPAMSARRLDWCTMVTLCMPIEVRNKDDVRALAVIAKRLLKGETTLAREFPDYQYRRSEWLAEAELRSQDNKRRSKPE